jgi:CHASE3 domain sensor protein
MLLPMILAVAISFDAHQNIGVSMQKVVEEAVEEARPVMHLQKAILQAAMPIHGYLIHGDPSERERLAFSVNFIESKICLGLYVGSGDAAPQG